MHPRYKCSDMLTALAISQIAYLPFLLIISLTLEIFAMPVTVTGWPYFCCMFDGLCTRNFFLHPPFSKCLIRYLIRPPDYQRSALPNDCVLHDLLYKLLCYCSSRFPTIFTTIMNEWLYFIDYMFKTLWSWRIVLTPFEMYYIKLFKNIIIQEIVQGLIALCYNTRYISNSPIWI